MAKAGATERIAREVAEGLRRSRDAAEQLGLFAGPVAAEPEPEAPRATGGRPKGAIDRAKRGLLEYMAAKGYRAPGEALAASAGLTERGDPFEIAFARALWLMEAAGFIDRDPQALATLTVGIWREQNAAAAQLLPYTLRRLAPHEAPAEDAPAAARVAVFGSAGAAVPAVDARRFAPAQVRAGMLADQRVSGMADRNPDAAVRTEGPSD